MKPTPLQQRGIEVLDRSVLISAAAGSGKTAVLARRCAHIVCWSEKTGRETCSVENLLVVTFTNAAAQEMRQRIARQLAEELAKAEGSQGDSVAAARLRREIALLPRAHISTLSSFCANLVRRHFNAAGVDPNFAVLDEDQARLLKLQSARAVLDEQYEADDPAFIELIELYADGYDPRLIDKLIACHDLQMSMVSPVRWRQESLALAREAAEAPIAQSTLGGNLLDLLISELGGLLDWARQIRRTAEHFGLAAYVTHINECMIAPAMDWLVLAEAKDLRGLIAAYAALEKAQVPRTPKGAEGKDEVHGRINTWKKFVTQGPFSNLLRFSEKDWKESMQRVISPMQQFLRLTELFEATYERGKASLRALDFADLERLALRLLLREPDRPETSGPSDIALYYQRQFHHVLVDEFQDINQVQDRLLSLLSRETAPEEMRAAWQNNLFAVGDVKQSIYRFRLAEPEMFKKRARYARDQHGKGWERIDLQQNFRSRQPLLEALNEVFSRLLTSEPMLEIDYADAHQLHPDPGYAPVPQPGGFPGKPVEIHVLEPPGKGEPAEQETREEDDDEEELPARETMEDQREADRIEREATLVATRIQDFIEEGRQIIGPDDKPIPLSFRHVAVLLRSRKYNSERFAGVLRKKGVPCFSEIGTGFFASLEVRDILSLLAVLDNRRQDIPLAAVLRSPLVDLPEAEDVLARVRLAYPWKDVPFFEAVIRYAREKDDAIAARLCFVLEQLDRWRSLAQRRPIAELLWQIYEETGYLAYVAGLHDGEQRTVNLLELHRRAGQFDAFARQGLGAFMEFLHSLEEAGEVGQPPTLSEANDVVRVMSIHAAKGLEFPVVFLADCGKRHNLMDTAGSILLDRRFGVAMQAADREKQIRYPSLVHELAKRDIRRASLAEELRVLYVAMTRAREHLVCVGTALKDGGRDVDRWRRDAGVELIRPAEVLRAYNYLEWLGRAAGPSDLFDIHVTSADQIDQEAAKYSGRAMRPQAPLELANLEPLNPPPPDHDAGAAMQRLTAPYPFANVACVGAAVGVTSIEPAPAVQVEPPPVERDESWRITQGLRLPSFLTQAKAPPAAQIGTATHICLRLLDLGDLASAQALERQIEQMIARRQLEPRLAQHVDRDSILWVTSTDLGRLLARHNDRLLRELPVRVPAHPLLIDPAWSGRADGPMDRVLLRGQIDVALPREGGGLLVVDYKTDRFEGINDPHGSTRRARAESAVAETVSRYRRQLGHYCRALAQITGESKISAHLVLLSARRIENL